MDEMVVMLEDLAKNKEGSQYFEEVREMAKGYGIEARSVEDLQIFLRSMLKGGGPQAVGDMRMPEGKPEGVGMQEVPGMQRAGVGGLGGLIQNIGPALKWLLGGSNRNPYGASNWGTAGEQFTRSIKRMTD